MNALVLGANKNDFDVECEDGCTRECSIKGKILKSSELKEGAAPDSKSAGREYYNPLAPGDEVVLEDDTLEDDKGLITDRIPRKNEFVRWNVKKRLPQVLAANLDYLLVVTTPCEPEFAGRFVDKALTQAEKQGIEGVVVCNKYDLEKSRDVERRLKIWEDIGYRVIRMSARTGEGLEDLAALIEGKTSAFVGKSGVGKSSIINVLDNNVVLKTGSLSKKYGRGTHTTTKGTLIHLELNESLMGGRKDAVARIIDTPGVKNFMLYGIQAPNLAFYYREFAPFLGKCTFGMSCSHLREEGCAVCKAVLDGVISKERYDSWRKTYEELRLAPVRGAAGG